ncbi:MAG TPA: VWA domain-containing protein, partial [Devosia sp.]
MRWLAALVLSLLLALPTAAAERVMLVLDASGSMWAQLGGVARITTVRQGLDTAMNELPPGLSIGLTTFGHRQKGACGDIEVLTRPAEDGAAITYAAGGIIPKGRSDIANSLRQAAEALDYKAQKSTVIVLTDGLDTCGGDPCAVAGELEQSGKDFTAHVLGFGLSEVEARQLACIADQTGGQYVAIDNGNLGISLKTLLYSVANVEMPPPPPEPLAINFDPELLLAEGGPAVEDGAEVNWEIRRGDEYVDGGFGVNYQTLLQPGDYTVRARLGSVVAETSITADMFELAAPTLVLNAAKLTIRPVEAPGGEANGNATVSTTFGNGESTSNYGEATLYVPAGELTISARIGQGEATDVLTVSAGEVLTHEIVVAVGHVMLNAFYVPGFQVDDSNLSFNVVGAEADIQGYRRDFGSAYGADAAFDLSPGRYVAIASLGDVRFEQPFTVTAGG